MTKSKLIWLKWKFVKVKWWILHFGHINSIFVFFFFSFFLILNPYCQQSCRYIVKVKQINLSFPFFFFFFHSLAFPLITHLAQNSKDYLDMWCKIRLKLKKSGMKPRLGIRGKVQTKKRENKSLWNSK